MMDAKKKYTTPVNPYMECHARTEGGGHAFSGGLCIHCGGSMPVDWNDGSPTTYSPGPGAVAMARELVHHIREAIGAVPGTHVVTLGQDVHDPAEGPWEFAEVAFVANNELRKTTLNTVEVVAPWYLPNGWEVQVRR